MVNVPQRHSLARHPSPTTPRTLSFPDTVTLINPAMFTTLYYFVIEADGFLSFSLFYLSLHLKVGRGGVITCAFIWEEEQFTKSVLSHCYAPPADVITDFNLD